MQQTHLQVWFIWPKKLTHRSVWPRSVLGGQVVLTMYWRQPRRHSDFLFWKHLASQSNVPCHHFSPLCHKELWKRETLLCFCLLRLGGGRSHWRVPASLARCRHCKLASWYSQPALSIWIKVLWLTCCNFTPGSLFLKKGNSLTAVWLQTKVSLLA